VVVQQQERGVASVAPRLFIYKKTGGKEQ